MPFQLSERFGLFGMSLMNIFAANFQQLFPSKRVILHAQSFRYRRLWASVFTFNPYLLISINQLLISIIDLLISTNQLLISIIDLLISINQLLISIIHYWLCQNIQIAEDNPNSETTCIGGRIMHVCPLGPYANEFQTINRG